MCKWRAAFAAALAAMSFATLTVPAAHAQANLPPRPEVETPRIYVLDCGTITNDLPELFGLTRDEVSNTIMATMCFLVVHPQGTLLFDTGLTDRYVLRPLGEVQYSKHVAYLKMNTLIGQLADVGYTPEMIDYLVVSHHHHDHTGNANAFARTATWLVPQAEWEAMFGGEPQRGFENYSMLREAKTEFVEDGHDVFGDGKVIIHLTPGHSPGHVVLEVELEETGHLLLGGDLYHYPEEMTLDRMPEAERTRGTPESRARVAALAESLPAQVWIAHDLQLFRRIRRAPAYYE